MSKTPTLEELDSNFQDAKVDKGIAWYNSAVLSCEGQAWPLESEPFCRLPDRAETVVREPVWHLSRHSAGLAVRFVTNSPEVYARWDLRHANLQMSHMPASGVSGLDLYTRNPARGGKWQWAGAGKPTEHKGNDAILVGGMDGSEREYILYLPLYNGVTRLLVGVPEGQVLRPAPNRAAKPICFYGTSIVHGGCASRPGMSYPALVSRWLDLPHYNMGFSGNGQSEPEVAQLLAELDPCAYVLDPLPNMQEPLITERMPHLVQTLRQARPETPIVLVENISYQHGWLNAVTEARAKSSNAALRHCYEKLLAQGVTGLNYLPGDNLLGQDGEGTVDGVHPTDVGFMRMAEAITPLVSQALDN